MDRVRFCDAEVREALLTPVVDSALPDGRGVLKDRPRLKIDRVSPRQHSVAMKMTVDLPDTLMRQAKIRAASEGLKLQELIADFVQQGLERPQAMTLPEGELPYYRNPESGRLVIRSLGTPGFKPPTPAESLTVIEHANKEEDLRHAGLLR